MLPAETPSPPKGFANSGDNASDYSDQSSSYWPEGWSFQRFRAAEQKEFLSVGEDELAKFRAGLLEVLGEEGVIKMANILAEDHARNQEQPPATQVSATVRPPLAWLDTYQNRVARGRDWGFVAFKAGNYGVDEAAWADFKTKLDYIARLPFRRDIDEQPPVAEQAAQTFRIHWEEDIALQGATVEQLQNRFATLSRDLPQDFVRGLFLVPTTQAVSRILAMYAAFPECPRRWRPDPPYMIAVAPSSPGAREGSEDGEEGELKTAFKVAVEVLVDEMWVALTQLGWSAGRFTEHLWGVQLENGTEVITNPNTKEAAADSGIEVIWWSLMPSPERMSRRRRLRQIY